MFALLAATLACPLTACDDDGPVDDTTSGETGDTADSTDVGAETDDDVGTGDSGDSGETGDTDNSSLFLAASTTIALIADESRLVLTSPDDNRVVVVDAASLDVTRSVEVGVAPEQLAVAGDGVIVTHLYDPTVARIRLADLLAASDASAVPIVKQAQMPCGGTSSIVCENVVCDAVWVACPYDATIIRIDSQSLGVTHQLHLGEYPGALAVNGTTLAVSLSRRGELWLLRTDELPDQTDETTVQVRFDRDALPRYVTVEIVADPAWGRRAVSQFDSLASLPRSVAGDAALFAGAFQLVDHDGDRERPAEEGGYGNVLDGTPRIEPRLVSPFGGRYARFDGGLRVFSGPSAIAYAPATRQLWVTHRYTSNVATLDAATTATPSAELRLVQHTRVNAGPRGIVVTRDGKHAYVDSGFAWSVARIDAPVDSTDLSATRFVADPAERTRAVNPLRYTAAALKGRSLFHDATNIQLTPSGVVTCATCHPGGGEDGLNWFLHTPGVPRKLRRTPAAWNAKTAFAPYHWDAEFTDAALLASTTARELMQGEGLLVDFEAIAAYMNEAPIPVPVTPASDEGRALVEAGRALFQSGEVGCFACHAGAGLTDGQRHEVVADTNDVDARVPGGVVTPTLLGVRARAPYLHDGRAATLEELFVKHNKTDTHGKTSKLTQADLDALVAYLRSL